MTDCLKCNNTRIILHPMDTHDSGLLVYHWCECMGGDDPAIEIERLRWQLNEAREIITWLTNAIGDKYAIVETGSALDMRAHAWLDANKAETNEPPRPTPRAVYTGREDKTGEKGGEE